MNGLSDIRQAICREAEAWIGTPYHDLQGLKGVGADCARFPLAVAKEVGLIAPTYTSPIYSPTWHIHQREELYYRYLEAVGCREVPWEARQPGDLVLFRVGLVASHAAILLPGDEMVHAVIDRGVIQQALLGTWLALHDRVYVLPGVES